MPNKLALIILIIYSFFLPIYGQNVTDKPHLSVKKTHEILLIDGQINEVSWKNAQKASNFIQNFPTDSIAATSQTEVSITYNDQFLYVSGKCYENSEKKHIMQSLKRDFNWPFNENFSIYFDPYNDYTNGFTFGITPAGVQREGLVTNGQEVSSDWDNKWFSAVSDAGDYWTFEMAIPFKSIRYNPSNREWNMIFLRQDLKNNERSSWAPVPQGYRPSFNFAGKLFFEDDLPKAGVNVSLIPFVTGGVGKNYEEGERENYTGEAGFDAKIALSSALNLDLTFNPDFSQVEVDQQVTNLNRFELFFPERRQFFLENNDLFGTNGFRSSRPFFSRRIGITSNDVIVDGTPENVTGQVPILYGARLSGKIGGNWRVGALNMMTKEDQKLALPNQMYSVGIVRRKLFTRSNIGFIVVNKNNFNLHITDTATYKFNSSLYKVKNTYSGNDSLYVNSFNTVYGTDFVFRSADNKWESNIFYHRSTSANSNNNEFASGAFVGYNTRTVRLRTFSAFISDDYSAEVGFIRRTDIKQYGLVGDFFMYPSSKKINNHGPRFRVTSITDMSNSLTDYNAQLGYNIQLMNTGRISIEAEHRYEKLRGSFDPTRTDGVELLEEEGFYWNTISTGFNTDARKVISFEGGITTGGFYNGQRTNVGGQFNYRYQPFGSINFRFDYNNIDMPSPYNSAEFWLFGPRIDLTFTDKIFLTTFVQYNEQADNVNINARLQWRYKPASDLFIVYTDNYFPDGLVKNRALVMKFNYWFNI